MDIFAKKRPRTENLSPSISLVKEGEGRGRQGRAGQGREVNNTETP